MKTLTILALAFGLSGCAVHVGATINKREQDRPVLCAPCVTFIIPVFDQIIEGGFGIGFDAWSRLKFLYGFAQ